jgi:hypothetical protein
MSQRSLVEQLRAAAENYAKNAPKMIPCEPQELLWWAAADELEKVERERDEARRTLEAMIEKEAKRV